MRLINLTPEELRCPMGDCPAVYKDENGRLFIIGENITIVPEELKGKIGSHERLIAIEPAFFRQISEFQENDR